MDSWAVNSTLISLNIPPNGKVPVHYQYKGIVSEMDIYSEKISFYLDDSGAILNGDIIIEDGEYYTTGYEEDNNVIEVIDESSGVGLVINMSLEMGSNNRLYWPSKDLPIVKATINQGDRVKIDVKTITEEYSIVGSVSIIDGEVDYSGNPFILQEGEVALNITPNESDPYIKILGSKTVIDNDDHQVEVFLSYEGGFFSDFSPTFSSSDPGKSPEEISALIGIAIIGSDTDLVKNVFSIFAGVGDVATSYLTAPVEAALEDMLPVDDVKIKSGFLSSLLSLEELEPNITNNSFEEEDNSEYNLSQMLSNTSITFGKFVTNDFFVKGSIGSIYEDKELNLDVDLGLTLYSPHFQLGFNLKPKLSNEYVFKPEISLSLEWSTTLK